MDWITPQIAVGNVEDALSIGGDAIVDAVLCLSGFPTLSHVQGLEWMGIPLIDGPGNAPEQMFEALLYIHRQLLAERKILVHCMEGRSRSVLMVSLYLAVKEGIALDSAIEIVQERRSIAAVDGGLLSSLPDDWRISPAALLAQLA